MGRPVVHFEIIGREPARLRDFYGHLFDWEFDTSGPVAPVVSETGNYGFVGPPSAGNDAGIPGGVGGGADHEPHALFYVSVPDVEVALTEAERLGANRRWGPERSPGSNLVVGQFVDPEGNLIGVAALG